MVENLPRSGTYGLSLQMRRASVAIASNIVEGQKRGHNKEFLQFLYISYGSGGEIETQIEICKMLFKSQNLDYTKIDAFLVEVMKMLNALIRSIKNVSY